MRKFLLLAAIILGGPAAAEPGGPVCHPSSPPSKPVNSEDFNPGFGATTGLNDDFHDDLEDPLDHPGAVLSAVARVLAQDDEQGGVHLLRDFVGLDCRNG